jgi:hypothetical protein
MGIIGFHQRSNMIFVGWPRKGRSFAEMDGLFLRLGSTGIRFQAEELSDRDVGFTMIHPIS